MKIQNTTQDTAKSRQNNLRFTSLSREFSWLAISVVISMNIKILSICTSMAISTAEFLFYSPFE